MPRPTMCRKVSFIPANREFKACNNIDEASELKIEEVEAIRLKDILSLHQSECAKRMNVSRQTFQNILESARVKIATALVNGKNITIDGGHYNYSDYVMKCSDCNHEYKTIDKEQSCPKCESSNIKVLSEEFVPRGKCGKRCCKRR
jgi:predicted DNA-binding protein (UPF0251 family)